ETVVKPAANLRNGDAKKVLSGLYEKSPKQAECLSFLLNSPDQEYNRADIIRALNISSSVITGLVMRGFVLLEQKQVIRDYYGDMDPGPPKKVKLNPDQRNALEKINVHLDFKKYATFLLHGVTGSGKTQVYIEAIYHVLEQKRTAIVLVPEISLTPQMVSRFRSHFGDTVAVFHSRMSPGERYDSWRATWEGKFNIVIGPRSAIYSPLKNIGLIVVDEEHENSYKQYDLTPRYHARDVSIMRAQLDNALVVLGSATPAVETFFNAWIKKYHILSLPKRIDDIPMPEIKIIDMRKEPRIIGRKEPIIFSRTLREKIDEKLALGEQIILLQNRRGFATFLKCKDCGYLAKCKDCDITLTFHLKNHLLKCHYCGHVERAPLFCPQCQGVEIFYKGIGTQRVEEELHELFPGVSAVRMDLDTTRGRLAHDKILSKFGRGEYRILLGTQMVAKGLDFPNVTLVGVISADTELLFPDFRAGERAFQILTQVSGRAGRKEKQGEVVIQTYSPDHYSLYYTRTHDYDNFFKVEIMDRKELNYPPFSRIINIVFKGPDQENVQRVTEKFHSLIDLNAGFEVKGPAPATLSKIQGNFRWQILFMSLKSRDTGAKSMKDNIRRALQEFKVRRWARDVTYTIDVDPVSIL
ncbi:primosomal protein N', partial [candidate division KSB1 bacterium]|nr:primosomal protein N' [candidate division KSB1 bacterium]